MPSSPAQPRSGPVFSLEAGIAASLRMASAPAYVGYGLSADVSVLIDHWLLGSWLRWDFQDLPVHQKDLPRDLAMASFLLGVFAGRRFDLGAVALDLVAVANVVIENQEAFEGTPQDVGGESGNLTVGINTRIIFPARRTPRAFLLVASECYPERVGRETRQAETLPPLPAWSTTVALGVAWRPL
jgi:hypothetical protein